MLITAVMLKENSKTAAHCDLKDNEMLWKQQESLGKTGSVRKKTRYCKIINQNKTRAP